MVSTVESYHRLMDDFPDAVVVHDGRTILYANNESLRLIGASSASDVLERPLLSFVPPRFLARVQVRIDHVAESQLSTELLEEQFIRLDGTEVDVEVRTMPLRYGDRDAIQLVARDCTERKLLLAALQASESQVRQLVTDMMVGVIVHGPDSEILLSNPRACDLLGLSESQLKGKTSFDPMWRVIHEDGSEFPGSEHPSSRALATGRPALNVIMGVFHPFQQDFCWLRVDAVPRFDTGGRITQAVVTFVDVTDRRRAEARVASLLADKELLLKEVHHRIKNNMATVKGLLFLHAESVDSEAARRALRDAEGRIDAMVVLYDKLYRSEDYGAASLSSYLSTLVQEIFVNFAKADQVILEVDVQDFTLTSAQLQSVGILLNELLTNSMKYAFVGRASGRIRVEAEERDGLVRLAVTDDGVGLPAEADLHHPTGFGHTLVSLLAQNLHAEVRWERGPGTRVTVEFRR
jgi:PAS domain S-box-containing protein